MESELFKDITEDMKENERGKEEEEKKIAVGLGWEWENCWSWKEI